MLVDVPQTFLHHAIKAQRSFGAEPGRHVFRREFDQNGVAALKVTALLLQSRHQADVVHDGWVELAGRLMKAKR